MKKEFLFALFFFSAAIGFSQSSKMPESVSNLQPAQNEVVQKPQVLQNEKAVFDAYSPAQKTVLLSWGYPEYIDTGDDKKDREEYATKVRAWRLDNEANMSDIKTQMQTN